MAARQLFLGSSASEAIVTAHAERITLITGATKTCPKMLVEMCEVPHTQLWATPLALDAGEVGLQPRGCVVGRGTPTSILPRLPYRNCRRVLLTPCCGSRVLRSVRPAAGVWARSRRLRTSAGRAARVSTDVLAGGSAAASAKQKRTIRKLLDEELAEQNG